ncbi:MAG: DUF342 domain-containing protein [Phycisphaeraceae bacterium]|nr:DUF342 domain-containing protein [Phycisphaeraceae bacterium]
MSDREPIEVVVSADGLAASLRAPAGVDRALVSAELVTALLADARVRTDTVEKPEVEAFIAQCRAAPPDEEVERVVARGAPARHGEQGRIELVADFARARIDDDGIEGLAPGSKEGAVDHHARSIFLAVREGDRIARVIDPTPGVDGVGVTGRTVVARPGREAAQRLHHSVERRGHELFAKVSGALEVGETMIRVSGEVTIPGFVDFTTGNIELPCSLIVEKGVRDGFVVSIEGSLTVRALVEAATVKTWRNATLLGGVASRGKGLLHVGRDLHTKYLDQVKGRVMRDAAIEREIVNCDLSIGRNLRAPTGSIMGGRVAVAGECVIDTLGSESGAPTELILGRVPEAEGLLSRAMELKGRIGSRLDKTMGEQRQLQQLAGKKLTPTQAERATELQYEISTLSGYTSSLENVSMRLLDSVRAHSTVKATISARIHAGVTVRVGAFTARFRRELRGPVMIHLNQNGQPVVTDLLRDETQRLSAVAVVEEDPNAMSVLRQAA